MKAPMKIYATQIEYETHRALEVSYCRVEGYDEYIRKDALLEWAEEKMNINLEEADKTDDRFTYGVAAGFGSVVDKLKTL